MNLPKAIEELTRYRKEPYSNLHPYFSEAVDLSIEAIKAIEYGRQGLRTEFHTPLIGETEK